jgi:hypothetical protein
LRPHPGALFFGTEFEEIYTKRRVALFVALIFACFGSTLFPLPASAISLEIAPGPDTHLRSTDRFGLGTPSADCPAGYGCTAVGTTQECTVDDGATQVFSVRNSSDTVGLCPALAAYVAETNWHFELDVVTVTGGGQYAGAGSILSQSDADFSTPDPKSYCWFSDGRVRMKYDAGRAGQVSAVSTATFTPSVGTPLKIGTEYTAASNSYRCGYLIAGEFFQVGTTQTALAFTSGVRGAMSTAYSTSSTATITTDNWEDSTTLDPYVDEGEPDPDPVPTSDTADYSEERVALAGGRTVISVSGNSDLGTKLAAAACGQTLELATATYSSARTFSTNCDNDDGIIVRAAAGATATITNKWTLTGRFWIIGPNLRFSGANARIICQGYNNTIVGVYATGYKPNFIQVGEQTSGDAVGSRCEGSYDDFGPQATPWTAYGSGTEYFRQPIKMFAGSTADTVHSDAWFHHNHFHDLLPKPVPAEFGSGDGDAVELCEYAAPFTEAYRSGWYVEWNYFENIGQSGNAIIDAKCGGGVYRFNTTPYTPASSPNPAFGDNVRIDARVGPENVIESNWFGKGGSTIHSRYHTVCGNNYNGTTTGVGIRLHVGDIEWNAQGDDHQRAKDVHVVSNIGSLKVGHAPSAAYTLDVQGTLIENMAAQAIELVSGLHETTTDNRAGAATYDCPQATAPWVTASQVGPAGLAAAPADYKAKLGIP